jgi:hypothetical protein
MTSTQEFYERKFMKLPHKVSGHEANNIYMGHFKTMGTREGRLMTSSPGSKAVMDRFKSWHQLEYTLPPTVKERR